MYHDRNGDDLTLREYARLHSDLAYRTVRRETVGEWEVMTMWLGLDQGYGDSEKPLIFGTIGYRDGEYEHETFAATEEEALQNHQELKERLEQHPE